jgi:transcriptional regulator with XRE-family HTH domain
MIQTQQKAMRRLGRVPASPNSYVQTRRLAFGQVVRARRRALGLSQEKLAERAGCDRQSINRVENAAYSPSLDRVFLLANALGVGLADLFADLEKLEPPIDRPSSGRAVSGG